MYGPAPERALRQHSGRRVRAHVREPADGNRTCQDEGHAVQVRLLSGVCQVLPEGGQRGQSRRSSVLERRGGVLHQGLRGQLRLLGAEGNDDGPGRKLARGGRGAAAVPEGAADRGQQAAGDDQHDQEFGCECNQ
uniref:(northern house mosquito) hypothetical protein n=1 Tax=Culex pipiens TaxID=7175 RepID=A0A8D8FSK9_CULPI